MREKAELAANRANWDARAVVHSRSAHYDLERYIRHKDAISRVVEWDRRVLGDVAGLDLLHLQCHIGTDTISWARLGATVVGLDISRESLRIAEDLSRRTGAAAQFVVGDVLEADRIVNRRFDIVYTTVGVLCWVADIRKWARAVAACVAPGGRFYIRDDHPVRMMLDYDVEANSDAVAATDRDGAAGDPALGDGLASNDDPVHGVYPALTWIDDYFSVEPERIHSKTTYTGDATQLTWPVSYQWTHGLGAVITALAEQGLRIERVEEFDWLDWQPFPWMVQDDDGRWRFPPGYPRVPLAFSILASRPEA